MARQRQVDCSPHATKLKLDGAAKNITCAARKQEQTGCAGEQQRSACCPAHTVASYTVVLGATKLWPSEAKWPRCQLTGWSAMVGINPPLAEGMNTGTACMCCSPLDPM